MKKLTLIVLGDNYEELEDAEIKIISANSENLIHKIKTANSKYIAFVKEEDKISPKYIETIKAKVKDDFDYCFINYLIEYDYKGNIKIDNNEMELKNNKPYYGEYLWSYIFQKEKLVELIECPKEEFNKRVDELFINNSDIGEVLYYHNPNGKKSIKGFCYNDVKETAYYKNIIYMAKNCNGVFNGYITWLKHIGNCFANRYDITILYDEIYEPTLNIFKEKFRCVKRENHINYVCNRLLVTYSTYFYPKNITYLEENYLFIHGNMSDWPNSRRFTDDIYTRYIAVSKIAALKAKGYFPTENIEYILNPFGLDEKLLKPHLKLVSAQRNDPIKRPERLKIFSDALTSLGIPYTWNVFMDGTHTNENGLIYRRCVDNPLPYIEDSDYFISFSDSESFGYSVLEALTLQTKVIVTPLKAFEELGVKDGENGYIIPFEYFDKDNYDKLLDFIMKIYKNKDNTFQYSFGEKKFEEYNDLFV